MPKYPEIVTTTIKYDSPSGSVNIGKYIPPFEENKNGFGFIGVLIEDTKTEQLQCHICGEWHENLATHVFYKHKITTSEYKQRYGLFQSTALKSKRIRLIQSEVMTKMRKSGKKFRSKFSRKNIYAGNRKNKPKALESRNKYGVCELQILDRIIKLKNKLNKTPSLLDLKKEYGGAFITIINLRYQSYVELCRQINFEPLISNRNPKYSREYFLEKALSNEPSLRILTLNESRAFYKYFKGGINELKEAVYSIKTPIISKNK